MTSTLNDLQINSYFLTIETFNNPSLNISSILKRFITNLLVQIRNNDFIETVFEFVIVIVGLIVIIIHRPLKRHLNAKRRTPDYSETLPETSNRPTCRPRPRLKHDA